MRQFIQNESIIPYTDRIQELKERGISTILVIGGSSEYLKYGDRILLLEDYRVFDRTWQAKEILSAKSEKTVPSKGNAESDTHRWMMKKMLPSELSCNEFFYSQCVQIDNARYIKIDDITVDVTYMTALVNEEQINSLVWLLEKLLQKTGDSGEDLKTRCDRLIEGLFDGSLDTVLSADAHQYEFWLEEVRSLDLVMAAVRMRKK